MADSVTAGVLAIGNAFDDESVRDPGNGDIVFVLAAGWIASLGLPPSGAVVVAVPAHAIIV